MAKSFFDPELSTRDKQFQRLLLDIHHGRDSQSARGLNLNSREARLVASEIRNSPRLTSLNLNSIHLDEQGMKLVVDAIAIREDIQDFSMISSSLGPKSAEALLQGLAKQQQLRSVTINLPERAEFAEAISEESVHELVKALRASNQLAHVSLINVPFSENNASELAHALSDQSELFYVNIRDGDNPFLKSLRDAIGDSELPQLLNFFDNNDQVTRPIHKTVLDTFQTGSACLRSETPDFASNFNVHKASSSLRLHASTADRYAGYRDALPVLPKGQQITAETVFATTEDSLLCPAENPRTWQENPDMLATLFAQDATLLQRQTRSGASLLQCAFAFGNVKDTLLFLKEKNIRFDNVLASPHAQTTCSIAQLIEDRGKVGVCFGKEIWEDKTPAELRKCASFFSEKGQTRIPVHQRIYEMQAEQQSGIGR